MNTLHKNTFQFDYFSDNFIAFEKDFYKYAIDHSATSPRLLFRSTFR